MIDSRFTKLFQPGKIGKITTKNRIVMAAMGTNHCTPQGYINQGIIDHYEERARGGQD
jgi:2,4-dienoyl-CoA reductase-like NADH-dependent reductase (Old Yellow Enzyme family)